jgi:hypothetical protein
MRRRRSKAKKARRSITPKNDESPALTRARLFAAFSQVAAAMLRIWRDLTS